MLTIIPALLNAEQLRRIAKTIENSEFVDGKSTAGYRAKRVKDNDQLKKQTDAERALSDLLRRALRDNKTFRAAALPKKMATPMISRYSSGMSYGFHMDDAVMNPADALRTDLSATIFLNAPTDYDGGELVMKTPYGEQEVKLPKGGAVVYPSTTLHRVAPVSRGERLVAVTWIQSRIRDPWQRETLFDLDQVCAKLAKDDPDGEETDLAFKTYGNLLRMWAEV